MNLKKLVEQVNDRASFFEFVSALIADRYDEVKKEKANPSNPYGPGANGWENDSIEDYLSAALSWAKAPINGMPEELTWRSFAQFLYCGKVYE